jgi:alcohol dehydrogenase
VPQSSFLVSEAETHTGRVRAIQYEEFGSRPRLVTVPDPTCPDDGVIVEVAATGLCRSDWHGWMGHDPDISLPHVPGHEYAGVVAEVGRHVRSWHVGDRVTASFVGACGRCTSCRRGEHQVCDEQVQPGFTIWGSFAERVALPRAEHNLVRIPDRMPMDDAAVLGCRFGTAYRAVVHHGQITAGDWLAVHGCGGVGLSAVMIAVARGARVIAVDVNPAALDAARRRGAAAGVLAADADTVEAVRSLTDGGVQVSIDAYGSAATARASIRCLRKRGRHVQVGLLADDGGSVSIPMAAVLADELEVVGSHGMPAHTYPSMLAEIASGALDPAALVGRRIGLAEAADALAELDEGRVTGVTIIRPGR